MNQLPIVLLAKQLKYSLASQKIKTLEKAIELSNKFGQEDPKKQKIQILKTKYQQVNNKIAEQFRKINQPSYDYISQQKTQSLLDNSNRPQYLYKFLEERSICEVSGGKGSGKTCLLLHLTEKYLEMNAKYNNTHKFYIKIFNCTGGITQARLAKLEKLLGQIKDVSVQFCDISHIEQIDKILKTFIEDYEKYVSEQPSNICIIIDGITNFLLPKQNSKNLLLGIFKSMKTILGMGMKNNSKVTRSIIYTNYVQSKYELGHQDVYNHATYFSQLNSAFITHKYYIERIEQKQNKKWKKQNLTADLKYSNRIVSIKGQMIATYLINIEKQGISEVSLESYRELKGLYEQLWRDNCEDDRQHHDHDDNEKSGQEELQYQKIKNMKQNKKIVSERIMVTKKIQEQFNQDNQDDNNVQD